jgi:Ca2+-transporting ATPase
LGTSFAAGGAWENPGMSANASMESGFYRMPVEEAVAALASDSRRGLSAGEARSRLEKYGKNELVAAPRVPGWRKFLAQFKDTLVVLLLVAALVSVALWLREPHTDLP